MSEWEIRFSELAGNEIRKQAASLQECETIPQTLWKSMCANRMFGLCLPIQYGGGGEDLKTLLDAGRILVEFGGNPGIAMSWLVHEITAAFLVLRFGRPEQHSEYLTGLASGDITAAFAVSEPGTGAHPKHISTRAEKEGDEYILSGEKTYITNGPTADLFIVIASTGETESGRKLYSAFIVPKGTPGLNISSLPLDVLRPSPHGSISMENCRVPAENILGNPDSAYEKMVLPFSELENTLMAGLIIGGLLFLIQSLRDRTDSDKSLSEELFDANCAVSALQIVAGKSAAMYDSGSRREIRTDLGIYFHQQAKRILDSLIGAASRIEQRGKIFDRVAADLSGLLRIGSNAFKTRKEKRRKQWFRETLN